MLKIALGTVQFGVDYGINSINGQVQYDELNKILNYARSHNVTMLDTALAYGNSEQALGDANTQDFKIVTKTRSFESDSIHSKEVELLVGDFYQSLKLLRRKNVYGLLMHNADDLLKPGSDQLFKCLQNLKQKDLVTKIGVSIYTTDQLQRIINSFDVDLIQLPFNILDNRLVDSGMFSVLDKRDIEIHARSVFLQGLLLMTEQSRPRRFDRWGSIWKLWHEWLSDNKLTALEATIRHVISVPEISKALVGVDSKDQLRDIIKVTDGDLPSIPEGILTNDPDLLNPVNWSAL